MIPEIPSGHGKISVMVHGGKAVLSELSYTYPLKLLSPRVRDKTAIVYLLSYGGGLVGGDQVQLGVNVARDANLLLVSQVKPATLLSPTKAHRVKGFTKVFKVRPGAQATPNSEKTTTQRIRFSVEAGGSLFLLPDPVTCFRDASYRQIQTFDVEQGGSAVVLDWITSGRMATGEEWVMKRYYSLNEVLYEGKRIAKDVLLLEDEDKAHSLLAKLAPYHCYAMVILCGPQTTSVIASLTAKYSQISVFKQRSPPPLIWSITQIDGGGAVVRAAGVRTEMVKHWLRDALSDLSSVIGNDVYKRTFA